MFGTGLIVFRETLEAALFVGIVAASMQGVLNRSKWLSLGVVAGILGSILMALAMGHISAWADGIGQDIVTAGILSMALIMLAWHCISSANSHAIVQSAKHLGASTARGQQALWALAIAVSLAVLREGAETVLFVSGLMSGTTDSKSALISSIFVGLGLGTLAGWLIYAGLGKLRPKRLFVLTNALILLLAGSLASQLAKTINQADWISLLGDPVWDISSIMPNNSALGMILHGIFGFDANPSQLQLLFYLTTIALIWIAATRVKTNALRQIHTFSTRT